MKKTLLFLVLVLSAPFLMAEIVMSPNRAAITPAAAAASAGTFSVNSVVGSSTTDASGKTLFTSIVMPSSVTYMTTCVIWRNNQPSHISSVTFSGVGFSTITEQHNDGSGGMAFGCYDLQGPMAGTAYLYVGFDATCSFGQITALFNNTNSSARGNAASALSLTGTVTSATNTIVNASNEIVVDWEGVLISTSEVVTPGANQTQYLNTPWSTGASGGNNGRMVLSVKVSSANASTSDTWVNGSKEGHATFAVKP